MKFRFLWVGKTKNKYWRALQENYYQRLSYFVKCEIIELKDSNKESESKLILEKLNPNDFVCLLDVRGKAVSSAELAQLIEKWQNQAIKEITFVIGGAEGVSPGVVEKAHYSLSLSFLTFTHEMTRVILLEQLYRAFTIMRGFPYQK